MKEQIIDGAKSNRTFFCFQKSFEKIDKRFTQIEPRIKTF